MKPMSQSKMDMNKGNPDSANYFPEEAHHKILARPGEIADQKYPDTEEAVLRDQKSFVKDADKGRSKPYYRH